jgi:hypothetical protein
LIPAKGRDSVFLSFQIAAATYSLPNLAGNPTDTLEILLTTNCGQTVTSVYKKWGLELVTTGNVEVDTAYVPTANQWRKDSVYLGDFRTSLSDYIQVIFKNTTNFENNIYIDDINVYSREINPNLREKGILVTPNPFQDKIVVQHFPSPQNIEFMQVFNSTGQLVWQQRFALGLPGNRFGPNFFEIDLSGKPKGIYIVQIVYRERKKEVFRVVKLN